MQRARLPQVYLDKVKDFLSKSPNDFVKAVGGTLPLDRFFTTQVLGKPLEWGVNPKMDKQMDGFC